MKKAIESFSRQFEFIPIIQNADNLKKHAKFVVSGMGGSHLAADLLKAWRPEIDLIIHSDYGLPGLSEEELKSRLFIFSSYSGNTEEVLDGLRLALDKNLPVLVIAVGGKLIESAKRMNLPYIQMPDTGIQPRSALGFSFRALLKAMDEELALNSTQALASNLDPKKFENPGKELAGKLEGHIPVIYSSSRNQAIAGNWKIKFNETGKIPSFYNVVPELNHNEMTGFDPNDKSRPLSENFHFVILSDESDHPKVKTRMTKLIDLYINRGFKVEVIELTGENIFVKIFSSLLLADWASYYTALNYGHEPEQVPIVEEFKKMIAE